MKKNILKRTLGILLSTAVVAASLAGCGTTTGSSSSTDSVTTTGSSTTESGSADTSDSADTSSGSGDKVINVAVQSIMDFTFEAIGDSLMLTNGLLREGLTRYGDGVLVDGLAESYEHNDNYTQWTFHLRESGWSNGEPVTADDWVYAIGAMLDGTVTLSYPDFLYEIKNAREIFTGEADVSELGVTAVD